MTRWIAFDRETADAIRKLFADASGEIRSGGPVKAALELPTPSIVVLPSSTPGEALIAYFRPKTSKMQAPRSSIAYVPSGFLGLNDTPVLVEGVQPQASKAHWWQRKNQAERRNSARQTEPFS